MKKLKGTDYLLGVQHLFAMFGATVLVPLITGLNPAVALVSAGIGTLLFHLITKGKVPVFLGSSFAFMVAIGSIVQSMGIPYAQGGIMVAGLVYLVLALLVYVVGPDRIKKMFPPVVTGPIILVIGAGLGYAAIDDASGISSGMPTGLSWIISIVVVLIVIFSSVKAKGFFKLVPILIGIVSGYLLCMILELFGFDIIDFSTIASAQWVNIPYVTEGFFTLPKFSGTAILTIAPIAIVTFMEHIGDITTNGAVVGKDFFKDPGLHRTLMGDGIATIFAGFIGGPANTTYSENTGVLATTKNYNPAVLRIAAVFAIILGFFGKFGAILQTIPAPVKGGVEIILFGMIGAIGIRTMAEAKLDFTESRNLMIVAIILVLGVGINTATFNATTLSVDGLSIMIGDTAFGLSGLFVATIAGVVANAILPQRLEKEK
jgi:uracil permease